MARGQPAQEAPSFNKVAGCTHLSSKQDGPPELGQGTPPPAQSCTETLTDSNLWLVFLHVDLHPCVMTLPQIDMIN